MEVRWITRGVGVVCLVSCSATRAPSEAWNASSAGETSQGVESSARSSTRWLRDVRSRFVTRDDEGVARAWIPHTFGAKFDETGEGFSLQLRSDTSTKHGLKGAARVML